MSEPLLTATEAADRLRISRATFYRMLERPTFRLIKAAQPIGNRKYVAAAIDAINRGESLIKFGRRSA